MAGFTRLELEGYRGATLPDVIDDGVKLLFAGINPGLRSAAVQASFANRGNRFWRAIHLAGIVDRPIDTSDGFRPADLGLLRERGVGLTTLVNFATAKGSEITRQQLVEGRMSLEHKVAEFRPGVVAMLGVTAYRTAFARPGAAIGRQDERIGPSALWALPSPSGLNAHHSLAQLAELYREAAIAAGVMP